MIVYVSDLLTSRSKDGALDPREAPGPFQEDT